MAVSQHRAVVVHDRWFSSVNANPIIRTVEELSINAWPALRTVLVDGWVLRFANGYTRRSNSVNPLYPSAMDLRSASGQAPSAMDLRSASGQTPSCHALEEKVATCERLYRDKGLNVTFKMTAASCPEGLDAFLAGRGYTADAHTSVQLLDLRDWEVPLWMYPSTESVTGLTEAVTEEWFDGSCRMSHLEPKHQPTAWQLLRSIAWGAGFASIHHAGEMIACGLGVAQFGYVGLFDIVTDSRYRRRGYGQQLAQDLLSWGKGQGAHTAYLQVMVDNEPALGLYAKLGFRENYRYWYRVRTGGR